MEENRLNNLISQMFRMILYRTRSEAESFIKAKLKNMYAVSHADKTLIKQLQEKIEEQEINSKINFQEIPKIQIKEIERLEKEVNTLKERKALLQNKVSNQKRDYEKKIKELEKVKSNSNLKYKVKRLEEQRKKQMENFFIDTSKYRKEIAELKRKVDMLRSSPKKTKPKKQTNLLERFNKAMPSIKFVKEDYFTIYDASKISLVPYSTLYRWCKKGKVESVIYNEVILINKKGLTDAEEMYLSWKSNLQKK